MLRMKSYDTVLVQYTFLACQKNHTKTEFFIVDTGKE